MTSIDILVKFLHKVEFVCDGSSDYKRMEELLLSKNVRISNKEIWAALNAYKKESATMPDSPEDLHAALFG